MRVVLLGRADGVHLQRWAEALASRGIDLTIVTQHRPHGWLPPPGVEMHVLRFRGGFGYFANALRLRRILGTVRPELLNVHYASGYGTMAAIAGYRPTVLSVYGSDVFDFPDRSPVAARLIRWNLGRAQRIASTSHVMAAQVRRLLPQVGTIDITPFGVDSGRFRPEPGGRSEDDVTIGTVKVLAAKYGIDVLIRAFARLTGDEELLATIGPRRLRLVLVGDGPQRTALERLAADLGVADRTRFVGRVSHDEVPTWLNGFDVFVAASRLDSESFGVAVIEASSCELPVVVSDAGGLPEVVRDGITGIVVPRENVDALTEALRRLVLDADQRSAMGAAGRTFVRQEFEWDSCVDRMLACYASTIEDAARRS